MEFSEFFCMKLHQHSVKTDLNDIFRKNFGFGVFGAKWAQNMKFSSSMKN